MLELKKLLDGSVDSIDFSVTVDDIESFDDVLSGSARASGIIENHSGLVLLSGRIEPDFRVECARCGTEFSYTQPIDLSAKITEKLANDDEGEFLVIENASLDVEDLVRSTLILELPSRYLCSEDCKGLCPKCGSDLNHGSCSCDLSERDPRWSVLADFFDD